jgi:hypothetical protein
LYDLVRNSRLQQTDRPFRVVPGLLRCVPRSPSLTIDIHSESVADILSITIGDMIAMTLIVVVILQYKQFNPDTPMRSKVMSEGLTDFRTLRWITMPTVMNGVVA